MPRFALMMTLFLLVSTAWAGTTDATDTGGAEQALNLTGSARAGYFSTSANGQENVGTGSFWLKLAPDLGNNALMMVDGWVMNENSFTGPNQALLRQGYFNFSMGNADFRVGRQIIAWGRADKLNPTDNLTPYNYTLLTPESDDQRFGTGSVKATYHFQSLDVTGIWLPSFTPDVYPITPRPGVYFTQQSPKFNQTAIKLDRTGGDVDWSVSYFNGLDLTPDLGIDITSSASTNLILEHNRIQVLGMDAATVMGRYGLRAEAAYTWTTYTRLNDPLVKKPFLYAVAGGDRTYFDNFNVNVQYYFREVTDYQNPENIINPFMRTVATQEAVLSHQLDQFDNGVSLRLSDNWLNHTLQGEIAGIYSQTYHDYALKPKLIYAFNDRWTGTFGLELFRGGPETFYGQLRGISSVFVEIKRNF